LELSGSTGINYLWFIMQWERWLTVSLTEAEWAQASYVPKFDEYMKQAEVAIAMDIVMSSALFFGGEVLDEDLLKSHDYHHPLHLVCRVGRILNDLSGIEVLFTGIGTFYLFQKSSQLKPQSTHMTFLLCKNAYLGYMVP
jgi:hypothetical protein